MAAALYVLALLLVLLGLLFLIGSIDGRARTFGFRGATAILTLTLASVGVVLAIRRPSNPIGWIFLGVGVMAGVQVLAQEYAVYARIRGAEHAAAIATWVDSWVWVPVTGAVGVYVFLLFPTGRPPSPRWRWVLWTRMLGIVLFSIALAIEARPEVGLANPFFDVGEEVTGPSIGLGGCSTSGAWPRPPPSSFVTAGPGATSASRSCGSPRRPPWWPCS
jgi:hypothetical protein